MKNKQKTCLNNMSKIIGLLIILIGIGFWNKLFSVDALAESYKIDELYIETTENNLILENDNLAFLNHNVEIELTSNKIIEDVSFSNNYDLDVRSSDFKLFISFYCDEKVEDEINIKVVYDDYTYNYYNIYFVSNEYGIFISDTSIIDAFDKYVNFLDSNQLLIENYSNATKDTFVEGNLYWVDDISFLIHPLRRVQINILDDEPGGKSEIIGKAFTDDSGYFKFVFQNKDSVFDFENGGYDIFVEILAGDDNALVLNANNNAYKYTTGIYKNVETGSTINVNQTFYMNDELGQAFQISQAILTARDFAKEMLGYMPESVTICYPYYDIEGREGYEFYRISEKRIYVSKNGDKDDDHQNLHGYSSWDELMHEYGHHIQRLVDNANNPGGRHYINGNSIDKEGGQPDKDNGIRIAWAEGWATFFGQLAQKYYSNFLSNIKFTDDDLYNSFDFSASFSVENSNIYLGEGCEMSITAILWDIFDNENEECDNASLGFKNIWDITTISKTYSFSDFLEIFYSRYPNYKLSLCDNLSKYNFSAKTVTAVTTGINYNVPPTIRISNNGGSQYFYNNKFTLYFYDSYNCLYLKIEDISVNNYQISIDDWHKICKSNGDKVVYRVGCYQSDFPATGEYLSKEFSFKKPQFDDYIDEFTVSNDLIYKEFSYSLLPKQNLFVNLKFDESNRYMIQTFGSAFTTITLYDENMNELLFDDDSGFERNALINYYFESNKNYYILITTNKNVRYSILKTTSLVQDLDEIDKIYGEDYPGSYNSQINGQTSIIRFGVEFTDGYDFEVLGSFDSLIYIIDPSDDRMLGEVYSDSVWNDDQVDSLNAKSFKNLFEEEEVLIIVCSKNNLNNENYSLKID